MREHNHHLSFPGCSSTHDNKAPTKIWNIDKGTKQNDITDGVGNIFRQQDRRGNDFLPKPDDGSKQNYWYWFEINKK